MSAAKLESFLSSFQNPQYAAISANCRVMAQAGCAVLGGCHSGSASGGPCPLVGSGEDIQPRNSVPRACFQRESVQTQQTLLLVKSTL